MKIVFQSFCVFIGITGSMQVSSGVFRCVNPASGIEFRDSPCENPLARQEVLPYEYTETQKRVVQEEERQAATVNRRFMQEHAAQHRARAREAKTSEQQAKKKQQLAVRCEKTQAKIEDLNAELHLGCKLARCRQLKKQISHHQAMERRYCDDG